MCVLYTHIHTYTCIHIYTHTRMYVCMHVYVHIYRKIISKVPPQGVTYNDGPKYQR